MALFGKKTDINKGIIEYKDSSSALLLDVREKEEYAAGHIPEAINLPLSGLVSMADKVIPDKSTLLYLYCQSGVRSAKATARLKEIGYKNIINIGGINGYKGKLE